MHDNTPQTLVDLAPLGWTADRVASALAVATPNDRRVAMAAAGLLTLDDHAATYAAWCDGQATPAGTTGPAR